MLRSVTALVITLFISGCATPGSAELARLEESVAQAQYTADQALRYATSAEVKANEALELVQSLQTEAAKNSGARSTADKALKTAQEAKLEAQKATQRAERMFKSQSR